MAPKHEKGNTTGDHDAADARVRRARARCTRASAASACLIFAMRDLSCCAALNARAHPGGPAYAL